MSIERCHTSITLTECLAICQLQQHISVALDQCGVARFFKTGSGAYPHGRKYRHRLGQINIANLFVSESNVLILPNMLEVFIKPVNP